MAVRYDIAVGLTKGHKTTKIRRVNYKGDKKVKGLRGASVKNVSLLFQKTRNNSISLEKLRKSHEKISENEKNGMVCMVSPDFK